MNSFNKIATTLPILATILLGVLCHSVDAELKYVSVVFRHGDRTPDNNGFEMYPKDPFLNYDFSPTGLGQLTNEGKRREYKLGLTLKARYEKYLGKLYSPESVFAISSDYDRTKMSLQLVLAALFPPVLAQQWHENLLWQPIPARYLERNTDNMFLADECPLYKAEYYRVIDSSDGQKRLSKYSKLGKYLTEVTGKNISMPLDYYYLYHTLMAEKSMGLELPKWTKELFPFGELWNATILAYDFANDNTFLRRLYTGRYLRSMTENMEALRNGTLENRKKIYLHSGHETNVASYLYALGVYKPHVPEYSSAVLTELHHLNGTYFVKFLHYLGIPSVLKELKLPNCDYPCPLDDFLDITADLIPSDEELMCDKSITNDYSKYRIPEQMEAMVYNLLRTAKNLRNI